MSNIHLHIDSFNAGELSPLLGARFNVEKVMSGCRLLRNFIPHVHGPAFRRPGMEFMGAAVGGGIKSNLRGFNFSTSTGFILELHPDGLKVWDSNGAVTLENEVSLPYTEAECFEVQTAQVNDVVYLAHPSHAPRKLVRYPDGASGEAVWKLEDFEPDWPALGDENVRIDEVATPTVIELLNVPTQRWPEANSAAGFGITLSFTDVDTGALEKRVTLQEWNGNDWVIKRDVTWTTSPPTVPSAYTPATDSPFRLVYTGPYPHPDPDAAATATLSSGTLTLELDLFQPESMQPVDVEGEWQVLIDCPDVEIPNSAELFVQKWNGSTWVRIKTLQPRRNEIVEWRGPAFSTPTQVRFAWQGRHVAGGTMSIEQLSFPTAASITLTASHTSGTSRTLTASDSIFQAGHVNSYWQITHRRESSFVSISKPGASGGTPFAATAGTSMRVQGQWEVFTYGIWDATLYLEKFVNGAWETLRSWESKKDKNVVASGVEENEVELRLRVSDGTAYESSITTDFSSVRFTLEATDARVSGIVKITAVGALDANGKTDTATIDILTTLHDTTATSLWTEGAWSDVNGYPRTVALHGQRLWFGGTRKEPLRLWGSVVNDYENFRRSTYDDASVSFTPAAQQSNILQWMASFGDELVLGTQGDEWTISGDKDGGPITPTSVLMQRRSGYGSKQLPAVLMGDVVTFVQRGGRKVRQVAPRADGIVWSAADLTVLAEHVSLEGIVQMTAMTFPFTILWAVTTDGKLLGMTHETEQNVFAWHVHETDGTVESVAVVQGTESDEVWLSVLRNGQRNIERLDPNVFGRRFDELSTLCYSDGAVKFEPEAATATVTGLDHLNGKTVVVLGDGAELTQRVVSDGQITLEQSVSVAVVGLPFESKLQPTRRDIPLRDGTAQHRQWKTTGVGLHLYQTLACQVADAEDMRFETVNFRTAANPMDAAPPLFSGDKEAGVQGRTRAGIDIVIKTSAPLPLNIAGLTWKGDVSGE